MIVSEKPGCQPKGNMLQINTLGRFQVCFGEKEVFFDTERSPKLGRLFMYLITHRRRPANFETILEALWPEQEYTNPSNALKALIYRLKKKLENHLEFGTWEIITNSYGCYTLNKSLPYWLDTEIFETLCQEARAMTVVDPLLAACKYREALELYHGDYLPECHYHQWVLPTRYYYRRLFVRSVSELLELQKKQRLFSQIALDCEKALLIEHYDESIHLHYIEALLEEGKTSQAQAHYEHITSRIYQEMGANPSKAMRRVYRSIKADNEKSDIDFIDIRMLLEEREQSEGALLCKPDVFHFLCKMEGRQAERKNQPVCLGLMTLIDPVHYKISATRLQAAQDQLQQILLSGLRKGDVFSFLNESDNVSVLCSFKRV